MRILITGGQGQLGNDLITTFRHAHRVEVLAFSKNEMDITDEQKVMEVMEKVDPDIVINAAAYTAVDDCENHSELAYEVNSFGPYYLAKAAKTIGAKLIHISTDYVFNGRKMEPYMEKDPVDPLSVYGRSKLLGESFIQLVLRDYYIVRTSWLYGHHGNNFVKTMVKLAETGKSIYVVNDQIGSPTFTKDLAKAIHQLLGKPYGIYHIANKGSCSRFTFARAIFQAAGYNPGFVKPISTKNYGEIAKRPSFSVLSTEKLKKHGIAMRSWQDALGEFFNHH